MALTPGTALHAPAPPPLSFRGADTGSVGSWRCSLQFRAKAEFSQLPRVFACIGVGQLFLLNGTLSWSKFNFQEILLKIKAPLSPLRVFSPYAYTSGLFACNKGRGSKVGTTTWGSWNVTLDRGILGAEGYLSKGSPLSLAD